MADFVASLERPRRVMIMVKAGAGTDAVIDELVPLLEEGDIVIDAGNAHFPDTIRREDEAEAENGLHFVGTGVSGGEEGALNGPSIMPGGSRESYESLGPDAGEHLGEGRRHAVLHLRRPGRRRALREDGAQRHRVRRHAADRRGVRPAPAGHRRSRPPRSREIFTTWNDGDLESFLIEITAEVLGHVDAETGRPFVDVVLDQAEQKGTGRWTVQNALDLGVPITGIAEATFARALSGRCRSARPRGPSCPADTGEWTIDGPRRVRRGRPAGAVRVEGRRLRAGLRPDRRGQRGVRLGHRPRRDGADLARRLHHPGPVPEPDHRGVRARRRPAAAARRRLLHRRGRQQPGRLAAGGRGRRAERHPDARRSPRRWPTTTACAPSGCRRR